MHRRRVVRSAGLVFAGLLAAFAHGHPSSPSLSDSPSGWRIEASQGARQSRGAPKYAPGQLLVKFRRGVTKTAMQAEHARMRAAVVREFRAVDNLQLVRLPEGVSVPDAAGAYRQRPDVEYAEPNFLRYATQSTLTPNDPQFGEQWALRNTGAFGGTVDADMDGPEAWALSTGNSTIVIGVIDTGVDYNHLDLNANMYRNSADCNANGVDDDGNGFADDCYGIDTANDDSDPMDDVGHGTHVSGTIGAVGNNGTGITGVAWQVRLMACKFLSEEGGSTADAIACIDYFAMMKDRGVNIVATNNSWGGGGFSQAEYDAIDAHRQRGILFIAASGNEATDTDVTPHYPSSHFLPNIIAVANTDRTDNFRPSSNRGRRTVHLAGPGTDILSTFPGNTYIQATGTSMSAPHVTGVAVLLKTQNPSRDWRAIKNLILAGGDTKTGLSTTITQKRLNAYGSMTCSNSVVRSRLLPVLNTVYATAGDPQVLSALHINCASPNGNVSVTVDDGAETITLTDDGLGFDQVQGDGIYTGTKTWSAGQIGTHALTFPTSDIVTVNVIPSLTPYSATPGVTFSYRQISGTSLNLTDDSAALVTPPFPILFGGASFPSLYVGSNGIISFTGPFLSPSDAPLPTSRADTLVAPWWDDLYPDGSQNVYWEVLGNGPSRELVIEWRNIEHFCLVGPTVRFQVVFFEGSSDVLFNYLDTFFTPTSATSYPCYEDENEGRSASVGIQARKDAAWMHSFHEPALSNNLAILWRMGPVKPVITALSPFSALAGDSGFTLVARGRGFLKSSVVRWNGSDRATTFINAGELRATISAADVAAAGALPVTVFSPGPDGDGASAPFTFDVYSSYPSPGLVSVSPNTATANAPATFTVTGSNFTSASIARWNGADRPTTRISKTQLQFSITAADVSTGGSFPVTVFNPAPGGGVSSAQNVTVYNPFPILNSVAPTFARVGGQAFTLRALGRDFVTTSVVQWNGNNRPTTFINTGELQAEISAADIASIATAQVRVVTPPPNGGFSSMILFDIVGRPPNDDFANATVIPSYDFSRPIDSRGATEEAADPQPPCHALPPRSTVWFTYTPPIAGTTVTVDTYNADYDTVLSAWVGLPTTPVNLGCNDNFGAQITSRLVLTLNGTAPVYFMISTARTDGLGGRAGFSFRAQFANNPVPVLTSISPTEAPAGSPSFTLRVAGSNLTSNTVVRFNGADRSLFNWNSDHTEASATIQASDIATAGTAQVTLFNPAPGGGASNALPFIIQPNDRPIGFIDFAGDTRDGDLNVLAYGRLRLSGWAADNENGAPVKRIEIREGGEGRGTVSTLGRPRPDVAAVFGRTDFTNSGWETILEMWNFTLGTHTVTLYAVDFTEASAQIGNPITFTKIPNNPPFGAVDSVSDPNDGDTTVRQYTDLVVTGWAADPDTGAPVQGVQISVDGNWLYNGVLTRDLPRPDVAAAYGRSDFTNSGWSFRWNVGGLSPGTHTITAKAFDESGWASGEAALTGSFTITVTPNSPPFGWLDGVVDQDDGDNFVRQDGKIRVTGWAVDPDSGAPVSGVSVVLWTLPGSGWGTSAVLGLPRPDVATALGRSDYSNSGWSAEFNLATFNLAPGTYTVTARASDPAGNVPIGSATFTVTPISDPPFGWIDAAVDAANGDSSVLLDGTLVVRGWAADNDDGAPVKRVEIYINGIFYGSATVGFARPDVAAALGRTQFTNSGWFRSFNYLGLPVGTHTVTAVAVDFNNVPGPLMNSVTFTVAANSPPIGNIDQLLDPADGNTSFAQNTTLSVSGWAADIDTGAPIPAVRIYIDGAQRCFATRNLPRPDVATALGRPDYTNSGWSCGVLLGDIALGSHALTVELQDGNGGTTILGPVNFTVDTLNSLPFGYVDSIADEADGDTTVSSNGTLVLRGWAADPEDGAPVARVEAYYSTQFLATASLGEPRPDIAAAYGRQDYLNSGWTLRLNLRGIPFAIGNRSLSIRVVDSRGTVTFLSGNTSFTLSTTPPFGWVDQVVDAADGDATISQYGELLVTGWAVDDEDGSPLNRVEIRIDGTVRGQATLGLPRPDVAAVLGRDDFANSGYAILLNIGSTVPIGTHTVTVVAFDANQASRTIGTVNINVVVASSQPPYGWVDQVADASDGDTSLAPNTNLLVTGWAVDNVDGAPVTRVEVRINGNAVGDPTLGAARQDVADAFGRADFLNSGWSLSVNIGALAPGTYSVTVIAYDSAGASAQLGPAKNITVQ